MYEFIQLIKSRSGEHEIAFSRIHNLLGSMKSILSQELDSLMRVLYLLAILDLEERKRLVVCTVKGERWKISTAKGKQIVVTDTMMVDVSEQMLLIVLCQPIFTARHTRRPAPEALGPLLCFTTAPNTSVMY